MNAREQGLFNKFNVSRVDGRDTANAKHAGCDYFVLDLTHDRHAFPALAAYAESCATEYPALAADLRAKISARAIAASCFVTVPEVILSNGTIVPSFQVGQFLSSAGPVGTVQITREASPWVSLNYHEARNACACSGLGLLTELQALAIAHDISSQDINWTGGKVLDGDIYQGLRKGSVSEAQPGTYEPADPDERRWHQLSNGELIFDFAGNAYTWIFDDVQGDEKGIVARPFAKDSPSITTAPFPSMKKGMGWRPDAGDDWSGCALVRGGCWRSGALAGVFCLHRDDPVSRSDYVGFRCTK